MTTELAVLVPVLGRPQNVAPLVASFLENCPARSELWFIMSLDDKEEARAVSAACRTVNATPSTSTGRVAYITDDGGTWPQRINAGVSCIRADWFLCAADDITFTEGWWEATAGLRADPTIGVIGTNDSLTGSGNQAVKEGSHTCHPLIRATYIRDFGTWDGPGRAVSDEYHHWYVDNELVVTAKLRRAWAFCPAAVLEHNHPYWKPDLVPWDETYTLGEAHAEEDKATWFRRAAQYGPLQTRD